jgi:cell wall-associated NlpC family hydrolase
LHAARRTPHRRGLPGLPSILGLLLAAALAFASVGATPARAETPAQKIARLRAEALKVQHTIDRMNDQIETVVERYNTNQEALKATVARQAETARQLDAARRHAASAQQVLGQRIRAIYMDGPVTRLGQLLEVQTINDAVVMAHYQQSVTDADMSAIAHVDQSKRKLSSVADTLAAQQRQQQAIQRQLASQRRDIEQRLAKQRSYLDKLSGEVKDAVAAEQRRQEELRRQALARRLAAERAARLKAAQEAAAQQAAQQQATQQAPTAPAGPTSAAAQAVAFARAQLGKPYQWGATGPGSYDCSGLTMSAYASAGVSIPRTSRAQWNTGTHIGSMADLAAGDLVFYGSSPSTIHHVGLYIGDGLMIEAPFTGASVRTASINRPDYFGATRPTGG